MRNSHRPQGWWVAIAVWTLILVGVPPTSAWAQVGTGSITGTITDETGAVLPGVTVTAVNLATGVERATVSDESGFYRLVSLLPGTYSVAAELAGFTTIKRPEITVNIGSTIDLNMSMRVATLKEAVTVTGAAPLIESASTTLSNVITQADLESLPSRSRQYLDFALLMPATTQAQTQQGVGTVVGASRAKEGTLLVDGFYNLDEVFTMPKARHSQDSIQEFQVVTFGGAAEYGRALGGTINAVTKSGGNDFSGSAYWFVRNKNLNAQEFAEKAAGLPKGEFSRNQYGGSLGGPLVKNKAFFFTAAERPTEDLPYDNRIRPEDAAIIGLPPEDVSVVPRFFRGIFAMGKMDYNINDNHRMALSYTYFTQWDYLSTTAEPLTTRSAVASNLHFWDHAFVWSWTAVANEARTLHELRTSFAPRFYRPGGYNVGGPPLVPEGQINVGKPSNSSPPRVSISGVATFGSEGFNFDSATYPPQVLYTMTRYTNKHEVRTGVDYMYAHLKWISYSSLRGSYSFPSLAAFQAGVYNTFSQTFGDVSTPRVHQYFSTFVQDTYRPNDRMTLNYGLRYDLELLPKHQASGTPWPNDFNNVGPRFGISYDLTGMRRTFLKLSTGVYYDRIWQNITNMSNLKGHEQTVSGTWRPTTPGAPVYPNVFSSSPENIPAGVRNATLMPDTKIPTNAQVVGTLEHVLTPNVVINGSVVYSRGWYKEFVWDTNLEWDGQRWIRPDPTYRAINQQTFAGPAEYTAGFVEITRRGARLGFQGSVTVARSHETPLAASGITGTINDQRCGIKCDVGPAAAVPTVRGVVSGWYNITPAIQVSGILRSRTGLPVDPIASGLDLNGDQKFGDRTPGFGPYSFLGPSMSLLDVRFAWKPQFRGIRPQFYIESFNLLNTKIVKSVNNDYGPDKDKPGPRWFQPTVYYNPREIQLGVRLTF